MAGVVACQACSEQGDPEEKKLKGSVFKAHVERFHGRCPYVLLFDVDFLLRKSLLRITNAVLVCKYAIASGCCGGVKSAA